MGFGVLRTQTGFGHPSLSFLFNLTKNPVQHKSSKNGKAVRLSNNEKKLQFLIQCIMQFYLLQEKAFYSQGDC